MQHFSQGFTREWIEHVRAECGEDIFMVGEFWDSNAAKLTNWLDRLGSRCALFDSSLLYSFARTSTMPDADLRKTFDGSLVQARPQAAVTAVTNHDTQPGSTMYVQVEGFFKPTAYALILLRQEGYPSVFFGDLYGTQGDHAEEASCGGKFADLVLARKLYAYGQQDEYRDQVNCIGFVRRGTHDRPAGLACLMCNCAPGEIRMNVGVEHCGECWTNLLGWTPGEVVIDDEGCGNFTCPGVSIPVWVRKDAVGRDSFLTDVNSDLYRQR